MGLFACLLGKECYAFFSLHVFTFTSHLISMILSACVPSIGYPHLDAGNFHPFFFKVGSTGRKQKVCSVDGWPDLLVSYSTADPSCREPQSPALGALFCILEIPQSLGEYPLAPQLPLSSPLASSKALLKCFNRTGSE